MCLIGIAVEPPGPWTLVVAANRDEFHDRHSAPAAYWSPALPSDGGKLAGPPALFAGRDLQGGGTWLGMRRGAADTSLRVGALTNLRPGVMTPAPTSPERLPTPGGPQTPPAVPPSRGHLVADYLARDESPPGFLRSLAPSPEAYAGFNLLTIALAGAGARVDAWYVNNLPGSAPLRLAAGIHLLSNATLDVPWPKTRLLGDAMAAALDGCGSPAGASVQRRAGDDDGLIAALMAALADRTEAEDAALPVTGLDRDRERLLSAPFIADDHYGTRCSTVLVVGRNGRVVFSERSFGPRGRLLGTVTERFRLAPAPAPE